MLDLPAVLSVLAFNLVKPLPQAARGCHHDHDPHVPSLVLR